MATTCPRCGIDVQPDSLTCRQCGEPLPGHTPEAGADAPPPERGGSTAAGGAEETTRFHGPEPTGGAEGSGGWTAPPPPPQDPPAAPQRSRQDSGNLALLAHLSALVMFVGIPSFVGPLILWLWQRDQDPFVREQAAEALNFNLSVLIYTIVGGIIAAIFAIVTLGVGILVIAPLALALAIAWLVLVVVAGLRASNGVHYRYPITIRFVR